MIKSIYDEVLDIIVDSFQDPQDENNDCYMFDRNQMNKISRAIRKAQNQEKLLEQYKKVTSTIVRISSKYPLYVIRESEGKMVEQSFNRIKELEK